jgi:hypothetical protein
MAIGRKFVTLVRSLPSLGKKAVLFILQAVCCRPTTISKLNSSRRTSCVEGCETSPCVIPSGPAAVERLTREIRLLTSSAVITGRTSDSGKSGSASPKSDCCTAGS